MSTRGREAKTQIRYNCGVGHKNDETHKEGIVAAKLHHLDKHMIV